MLIFILLIIYIILIIATIKHKGNNILNSAMLFTQALLWILIAMHNWKDAEYIFQVCYILIIIASLYSSAKYLIKK